MIMGAFDNAAWLQHYAEWTPHSIDYGDTTLVDIYINNLAVNAANPATYFFGKTMTYADLDAQVRAAAASLKAFGIRPGDNVAILLPNLVVKARAINPQLDTAQRLADRRVAAQRPIPLPSQGGPVRVP